MARLHPDGQPLHVGDVEVDCPGCSTVVACPVLVEQVDHDRRTLALRAQVNVDPLYEHARTEHGLSRPRRR